MQRWTEVMGAVLVAAALLAPQPLAVKSAVPVVSEEFAGPSRSSVEHGSPSLAGAPATVPPPTSMAPTPRADARVQDVDAMEQALDELKWRRVEPTAQTDSLHERAAPPSDEIARSNASSRSTGIDLAHRLDPLARSLRPEGGRHQIDVRVSYPLSDRLALRPGLQFDYVGEFEAPGFGGVTPMAGIQLRF